MKPLTLARIVSILVGALLFLFLWWLSGTSFPTERGPEAVFFVVQLTFCSYLGYVLFHVIFHNWYWERRNK